MIRVSSNPINIKYSAKQNQTINDICTMLADKLITSHVESSTSRKPENSCVLLDLEAMRIPLSQVEKLTG